ncbi:MAG: hypothetical protein H7Y12_05845, partial [Sphingobacteriaceae bacterium]|nr:hypothetical protein [Cytophagaceae bacterium]
MPTDFTIPFKTKKEVDARLESAKKTEQAEGFGDTTEKLVNDLQTARQERTEGFFLTKAE